MHNVLGAQIEEIQVQKPRFLIYYVCKINLAIKTKYPIKSSLTERHIWSYFNEVLTFLTKLQRENLNNFEDILQN